MSANGIFTKAQRAYVSRVVRPSGEGWMLMKHFVLQEAERHNVTEGTVWKRLAHGIYFGRLERSEQNARVVWVREARNNEQQEAK